MTFAFDLDGTLNRYPKQLEAIMLGLKATGHTVVVLTACPALETEEQRMKMITDVGVALTSLDYLVLVPDDGISKAKHCFANNISMLVDDAPHNLENVRRISPATCCLRVV